MLDDESPSSRLLLGFCHTFAPLSHNFIIVVFVVVVTFVVAVLLLGRMATAAQTIAQE